MEDDSPAQLAIRIDDPRWQKAVPDVAAWLERVAAAALAHLSLPAAARFEIAVTLTDDQTVRELNARHRGRDAPTDVLSFPQFEPEELARFAAAGPPVPLGDIVLAYDTVCREAQEAGRPLAAHLAHLFVHGLLHLVGYDHVKEVEARQMERLESEILADLGLPDPYMEELEQ